MVFCVVHVGPLYVFFCFIFFGLAHSSVLRCKPSLNLLVAEYQAGAKTLIGLPP